MGHPQGNAAGPAGRGDARGDMMAPARGPPHNEYFVPRDGIDMEVLCSNICRYLGNDTLVRRGTYESPDGKITQGYFVTSPGNLTSNIITEMKAESIRWEQEKREALKHRRELQYSPKTTGPTFSEPPSTFTSNMECRVPPGRAETVTDSGYASRSQGRTKTLVDTVAYETWETACGTRDNDYGADDAATVYTAADHLGEDRLETYKSELADSVSKWLQTLDLPPDARERITALLPNLLKGYALRLGQHSTAKAANEVMYFVHKYRHDIARRVQQTLLDADDEISSSRIPEPEDPKTIQLRVHNWLDGVPPAEYDTGDFLIDKSDLRHPLQVEEVPSMPDQQRYRDVAFRSPAFQWLLAAMGKQAILAPLSPDDSMAKLRDRIIGSFPRSQVISSRSAAPVFSTEFSLEWDIAAFMHDEYPETRGRARLGDVITITGPGTDAQALTCSEYLNQTWPCTGAAILAAVQEAFDEEQSAPGTRTTVARELPDRTKISVSIYQGSFTALVHGTSDAIVETAEQIAWLACALGSSSEEKVPGQPTHCAPFVKTIACVGKNSWVARIDFKTTYPEGLSGSPAPNGSCWRSMFRNPVVVAGYPIRQRPLRGTGLEIPLHIMAGLVQGRRVHDFPGKTYIKGFSSMLVAVEQVDGVYIWHHSYNTDGNRVSYLDVDDAEMGTISVRELETARHIVGWCSKASIWAGSSGASYAVKRSRLPHASRDFALEKVSLSCGQILTGGCTFGIGKKDIPIHISRAGYIDKLRWISQKRVVFWDEADKRGWMVDGSSALLHLLRGSLEHSQTDKFRSQFLFDFAKLKERDCSKHDAVIDVLLDPRHRRMPVYPAKEETHSETVTTASGASETVTKTKTTYKTLEDTVEELYECLEKMIDHKSRIENPKGFNAKVRLRRHLEGWDFRDLVVHADPFHLRVATLPACAFSWVELTRSTQVVTLFGRGFGELRTPAAESNRRACSTWRSVPKDKYYLCAGLADLQELVNDHGGNTAKHGVMLAPGLAWVNPFVNRSPFSQCPCEAAGTLEPHQTHSSPVQHLVPLKLHGLLKGGPLDFDECENGAVIFGQGWAWPESGEPISVDDSTTIPQQQPSPDDNSRASETLGATAPSITGSSASQASDSLPPPPTSTTPMSTPSGSSAEQVSNDTTTAVPLKSDHAKHDMRQQSKLPYPGTPPANAPVVTGLDGEPASSTDKKRPSLRQRAYNLSIVQKMKGRSKHSTAEDGAK